MFVSNILWVLSCSFFAVSIGLPNKLPNYVRLGECQSSADCGPSKCCVIGMMRYSLPTCQPLLQLGETCRPASSESFNTTLLYPGGLQLSLINAYQILCPCDASQGLVCSRFEGVCTQNNEVQLQENII